MLFAESLHFFISKTQKSGDMVVGIGVACKIIRK